MYIYVEIATSGVNALIKDHKMRQIVNDIYLLFLRIMKLAYIFVSPTVRDWHGGVLTKLVISYPILELASIFWYHWVCNIQEGTIHMLTYSYTERNQPQRIKIRATPTFLVCLSPRVKCTQHPVWGRSLTFMLCSLYPVYLGCIPYVRLE